MPTVVNQPQRNAAPQPQTAPRPRSDAGILELVLDQTASPSCKEVASSLSRSIKRIEELLPPSLKSQAVRIAKRALLYFASNDYLQKCTPRSFISCVLAAAEFGLVIDGRLAHAVPFWNKDRKCMEAQFIADYKGIIVACRRKEVIRDAFAEVVYQNDTFSHGFFDQGPHLEHTWDITQGRGEPIGVWAKVIFPDNTWRYLVADIADIYRIRDRSKARDRDGNLKGPWKTDEAEMCKKTVLKRLLKTYSFDMELDTLLDHDEPRSATDFTDELKSRNGAKPATVSDLVEEQEDLGPVVPTAESSTALLKHYDALMQLEKTWEACLPLMRQAEIDREKFLPADWESFRAKARERKVQLVKPGAQTPEREAGSDDPE